MSFCAICNVEIDGSNLYLCKYCGENYCPDHRLPPKHDCIGIEAWKSKVPPNGVQLARKEVLIVKPYIVDKPKPKIEQKVIKQEKLQASNRSTLSKFEG